MDLNSDAEAPSGAWRNNEKHCINGLDVEGWWKRYNSIPKYG